MTFYSLRPYSLRKGRSDLGAPEEGGYLALSRQMNRLLSDFVSGWDTPSETFAKPLVDFTPRLNFVESENDFLVEAELPGMDEKDVEVSLSEGVLLIRGHKKHELERKEGDKAVYFERSFGTFERAIPLSCEVDEDKVDASFKKGVLTVKLAKSQRVSQQVKKVTVRSN